MLEKSWRDKGVDWNKHNDYSPRFLTSWLCGPLLQSTCMGTQIQSRCRVHYILILTRDHHSVAMQLLYQNSRLKGLQIERCHKTLQRILVFWTWLLGHLCLKGKLYSNQQRGTSQSHLQLMLLDLLYYNMGYCSSQSHSKVHCLYLIITIHTKLLMIHDRTIFLKSTTDDSTTV